jgi:hypothetical protein
VFSDTDLKITKVITPASYKLGKAGMLTPKYGSTLVVVQATLHKHGSTAIADWPGGDVYIDFLLADGSRANNPAPPYMFSNILPPGQTEWIFTVSTFFLNSSPLVLVLPGDISVLLALPAQ